MQIDVEGYLKRFGYLGWNVGLAGLAGALTAFRRAHGLPEGDRPGVADEAVQAAMRLPRCGCPDGAIVSGQGKWQKRYLGVFVVSPVTALPKGDQDDLIGLVLRDWEAVADLSFHRVMAASAADVLIGTARRPALGFDGPGGILAQAQLPLGDDRPLRVWLDLDERWMVTAADAGILYRNVLAHEIGHILGLDHSVRPRALMRATYSAGIAGPQADDDIPRIQGLYGPPASPPPPADPVAGRRIVIEFDGPVPTWRSRAA